MISVQQYRVKQVMYVSISEAARMAGIKSRSTMYRHIEKKGISVNNDEEGNPRIDVAELVRVYGDKIRMPEQGGQTPSQDSPKKQVVQNNTPSDSTASVEIEVLKERLKHLESAKDLADQERRKERELLADQIDTLKQTIEEAQGQNKRLTALLTDQSSTLKEKDGERDTKIKALEQTIAELKAQNDRLLAFEEERRKRTEQKRKAAEEAKKAEEEKKSRGLFQRIFK